MLEKYIGEVGQVLMMSDRSVGDIEKNCTSQSGKLVVQVGHVGFLNEYLEIIRKGDSKSSILDIHLKNVFICKS